MKSSPASTIQTVLMTALMASGSSYDGTDLVLCSEFALLSGVRVTGTSDVEKRPPGRFPV